MLLESIRLVAAPFEVQKKSLPDFVNLVDEVATTFGDAYLLVPQLIRAGLISSGAANAIKLLDDHLANMAAVTQPSRAASVLTNSSWEEARTLARKALKEMGEEATIPTLGHLKWFRAG